MKSLDEVYGYFVSGDSMSEADEAEITENFQDTSTLVLRLHL